MKIENIIWMTCFVLSAGLLVTCDREEFSKPSPDNNQPEYRRSGYIMFCINGVEYLSFSSGVAVAHTADGSIKVCK